MRGGHGRRRAAARAGATGMAAAALISGAACAPVDAVPGPQVPTFPAPATTPAAGPGVIDDGLVPDDCARLLSTSDLGALLGLALDTVTVRTTVGEPAPSVGRTERVNCEYAAAGGGVLLRANAAAYADSGAAAKQWRVNADAEDGDRRELPIGAASAVLVERPGETVLTVLYGTGTLTFVLPDRPLPAGRPPGEVLVDLALRVLPAIEGTAPAPVTPTGEPARAAGAVS